MTRDRADKPPLLVSPPPACAAPRCSRQRGPSQLLCKRHWSQLPALLQLRVIDTWRARQTDPRNATKIAAHEAAKQAAIDMVAG